jgi:hypothetical protein
MPCFAGEVHSRLPLAEPGTIFLNSLCLGPAVCEWLKNDDQGGRTHTSVHL